MARLQCVTCRGIYEDRNPDGSKYFHACSPLSRAELQTAVTGGTVTLRAGETVDSAHRSRVFPRPNTRDENVVLGYVRDASSAAPAPIKAAGGGTTVAP